MALTSPLSNKWPEPSTLAPVVAIRGEVAEESFCALALCAAKKPRATKQAMARRVDLWVLLFFIIFLLFVS